MDYRNEPESPTIKHRLISSCLLTPFRRNHNHHNHHHHHLHISSPDTHRHKHHRQASLTRAPSRGWGSSSKSPVRRESSDGDLATGHGGVAAMGKEKCMQFISRIGCAGGGGGQSGGGGGVGCGGGGHRRRHSVGGDFHYDALSYSLNFDDGTVDDVSGEFPSRDFSSRLPQSPPPPPRRNREIQCSF